MKISSLIAGTARCNPWLFLAAGREHHQLDSITTHGGRHLRKKSVVVFKQGCQNFKSGLTSDGVFTQKLQESWQPASLDHHCLLRPKIPSQDRAERQ